MHRSQIQIYIYVISRWPPPLVGFWFETINGLLAFAWIVETRNLRLQNGRVVLKTFHLYVYIYICMYSTMINDNGQQMEGVPFLEDSLWAGECKYLSRYFCVTSVDNSPTVEYIMSEWVNWLPMSNQRCSCILIRSKQYCYSFNTSAIRVMVMKYRDDYKSDKNCSHRKTQFKIIKSV